MTIITGNTKVYGVIGQPVAHSLGPVMHNRAFAMSGYPGVYVAFEVHDVAAAVNGMRALNIQGISVTIPHKESIIQYLDQVDDNARVIGAVNTVVNNGGSLIGYNTDADGAVRALSEKSAIKNKNIAILGAGGAARAIGFGLLKNGGRVHIINRSADKGKKLADFLGADFYSLEQFDQVPCDILINTTPVGMHPKVDEMPVSRAQLRDSMLVMDIIYNPLKTSLLETAEQIGAKIINGVPMFVYQGAKQFELWTGLKAPVDLMSQVVYDALSS